MLAVGGALRAGVGMVRYLGPPAVTEAVLAAWPEVVAGEGRAQALLVGSGMPLPAPGATTGDTWTRRPERPLRGPMPVRRSSTACRRSWTPAASTCWCDHGGLHLEVDRGGRTDPADPARR